jgi:exodeoxyribonuclease V alpha subunit
MNAKGPDKASIEEVSGLIERVTFRNEENGFCVLRVKVRGQRDEVTVLGSLPSCPLGSGWRPRAGGFETRSTGSNSRPG